MKQITCNQLEQILKEFCVKKEIDFRGIYRKSYSNKWIEFNYSYDIRMGYGYSRKEYEAYGFELDENNVFISVKHGLNKQLKGVQLIDKENLEINE